MSQILRPYQNECVSAVLNAIDEGYNRILYVMATGLGKTSTFSELIRVFRQYHQYDVLVLAHRKELIQQAFDRIKDHCGLSDTQIGCEIGEQYALYNNPMFPEERTSVVVGSIQTIINPKRLQGFCPKVIIYDEGHHSACKTAQQIFKRYGVYEGDCILIGLTATAKRGDKASLYALEPDGTPVELEDKKTKKKILADEQTSVFQILCYEYGILAGIEDGYSVLPRGGSVETDVDLDGVKSSISAESGEKDFNISQLQKVIEDAGDKRTIAAISEWKKTAANRQTLVFSVSVERAQADAALWRAAGHTAVAIDGTTDTKERFNAFQDFKSGKLQVIVNYGIACLDEATEILTTHGWVGYQDISYEHSIANWKDGRIWFAPPLGIEVRDRRPDERMVILETKRRSIRVTEDHRMLYRTNLNGEFRVARAHEIVNKACALPISGFADIFDISPDQENHNVTSHRIASNAYTIRKKTGMDLSSSRDLAIERSNRRTSMKYSNPPELSEQECELIGFWLGDGTKCELQTGGVEYLMWQSSSYPNIVGWVDNLIASLGIDNRRRIKKPRREGGSTVVQWSLCRGTGFGDQARKGIYHLEPYLDKSGSPLLWSLDSRQFTALIRGFWMADGEHLDAVQPCSDHWRLCNTNKKLFDLLQAIASCRGYRASITDGVTNVALGHKPIWKLSIARSDHHHMTKHRMQFEEGWKDEKVWCVKSDSGFIVTRRRGTVTITGNTEGTDLPNCSAIVLLRPTQSWSLYVQMVGRGGRVLPGVIDNLQTAEERKEAIARSEKPDCIAEGTLILTDAGLVPIEKVTLAMKVWDGIEFVSHCGTIYRGQKEVITYAGITATPDHRVWTKEGWKTFGACRAEQTPVCVTGIGRKAIRETDCYFRRNHSIRKMEQTSSSSRMYMRQTTTQALRGCNSPSKRLPRLWKSAKGSAVVGSSCYISKAKMHKPERSCLRTIWRQGNRVPVRWTDCNGSVDYGEPGALSRTRTRPHRQQRSLRTREFTICNCSTQPIQYAKAQKKCRTARIQDCLSRNPICRRYVERIFPKRDELGTDPVSVLSTIHQTKRGVWDILNAGPRHRFTAGGLLVSNCLVFDMADICNKFELCSLPSILDLPADMDLEGQDIVSAKRLLKEFEAVKDSVIGEHPKTFTQLQTRLKAVNLLRNSKAASAHEWKTSPTGFRLTSVPPGYRATMTQEGENWRLQVHSPHGEIYNRSGFPREEFKEYLDRAKQASLKAIDGHKQKLPGKVYETVKTLQEKGTGGFYRIFRAKGYKDREINLIPPQAAINMAKKWAQEWQAKKAAQQPQNDLGI